MKTVASSDRIDFTPFGSPPWEPKAAYHSCRGPWPVFIRARGWGECLVPGPGLHANGGLTAKDGAAVPEVPMDCPDF